MRLAGAVVVHHLGIAVVGGDQHRAAGLRDRGFEPVSYTHLRAHETVLDLVCRLLLEKKKNKLSSPYT